MATGTDDVPSARDGRTTDAAVPQSRAARTEGSPAARKPGSPAPQAAAVPRLRDPRRPPVPPPRPRIVDEPGILGLSRLTRGRFGSRLFNLFFVLVFAVILIQMISAILDNKW